MAGRGGAGKGSGDEPEDIEALLADVERSLSGRPGPVTPRGAGLPDEAGRGGGRLRTAAVSASVAAATVWVVFAVLPFLRAGSGAVGAFLATFVVLLVLGRRSR